jgi:hypothetical protein
LLAEVGFFELDEHGWFFLDFSVVGALRCCLSPARRGEWLGVHFCSVALGQLERDFDFCVDPGVQGKKDPHLTREHSCIDIHK